MEKREGDAISTKFKALGFQVSFRLSLRKNLKEHASHVSGLPNMLDANIKITTKTPEALASEILETPCKFRLRTETILNSLSLREIDAVAAPEARGFQIGRVIADRLHKQFIPIRKANRQHEDRVVGVHECKSSYYYGEVKLAVPHEIEQGRKVCLIDDDLLTGGTFAASRNALKLAGGKVVGLAVLIQWPQFIDARNFRDYDGFLFSSLMAFNPYLPYKRGRIHVRA